MHGGLIDFIIKFCVGLVPQKDDDAMQLYQWRWKSVLIGVVSMALGAYGASMLPFVKPPYAMAMALDDVKTDLQTKLDGTNSKVDALNTKMTQVFSQLKDGQVRQLNSDLIDAKRYQCRAINTQDRVALPFWNSRLQDLRAAYYNLTNNNWPDLDCKSF